MARVGVKGSAAASADAMYAQRQPGSLDAPTFGPGTVSRKVLYIWAGAGLWLFFVGFAAKSY